MIVNIIGSAPGWEECPEDNGYIWAVNNCHILRNVDLVIDIHKNRLNPTEEKDKDHMAGLEEKNIPTYANNLIDGQPHIMKYPIDEVVEFCGSDYFGSGIDYIIALAIYKGATEINIYGVLMARGSEYERQKPSCEHWIGLAIGKGIKVKIHGVRTSLLRTSNGLRYGFATPQNWVKENFPDQVSLEELIEKYEREPETTGIESAANNL